jgi:hypothetical protein
MPVHLLKMCVGCDSISELESWIEENRALMHRLGRGYEQTHTTRHMPKRAAEIVDGGSLFWVIKRQIAARQRLLELRPIVDGDGVSRCQLVLEPNVVAIEPRPYRPFQGWRYLEHRDAPGDLGLHRMEIAAMPETMRRELAELGLL